MAGSMFIVRHAPVKPGHGERKVRKGSSSYAINCFRADKQKFRPGD